MSPNTCSDPVTVSLNGQSITIYVKVSCTTPGSGCFSAHDTVVLDSGATVQYSSLQIGDRVLSASSSGDLFYDKVFRITHHDHAEEMDFLAFTTSDGKTLELTATHMLHIGTWSCLRSIVLAAASWSTIGCGCVALAPAGVTSLTFNGTTRNSVAASVLRAPRRHCVVPSSILLCNYACCLCVCVCICDAT